MTRLTVSVALCTFNGARFIAEQIHSILNQSLLPDEIVVSDDGSIDATLQVLRDAFVADPKPTIRLRILPQTKRLGITANFERALIATSGDLVALCDQDDVWHENRLAAEVSVFSEAPGLMFLHSDARLIGPDGAPQGGNLFAALSISVAERKLIAEGNAFHAYIRRNLATGATTMIRRTLLDFASPIPREWVHDEWLAIIAAAAGQARLIDQELIDYRQHGSNQIGVQVPTLAYRVRRMLQPRADRYDRLSLRAVSLVERLSKIDARPELVELAADKARFELVRSRFSRRRLERILPILAEWKRGSYSRLSSQGNLDVLRDFLQPSESPNGEISPRSMQG